MNNINRILTHDANDNDPFDHNISMLSNFVVDSEVPSITHMRYSAATCNPSEFKFSASQYGKSTTTPRVALKSSS
ncbi:hypothetical protein H0H92_008585 [Tricholoma furcatifolium]|nr:hypothetical protein H0H92_008585 [Tricholoma furcatifolium]